MRSYWSQSYNIVILLDFLIVALKERRGFWYMNTCPTIAWIHLFSIYIFVSFNSTLFLFVYSFSFTWYRCHKASFIGLEITFLYYRRDYPRASKTSNISRLRIIHRDLKTSNILLYREMNLKISDFGTARVFKENESRANTNRIVRT